MKTNIKNPFIVSVLMVGLGSILVARVTAQTFTVLHTFTSESNGATHPFAGVILSGTNLYGTSQGGGTSGVGTVFRVSTNGTLFTNLHSFTAPSGPKSTNSDGINPRGGVIMSGATLYGTASAGGAYGNGTVFAMNTDGTDFRTLYNFDDGGIVEISGLIISSNILYGTIDGGGAFGRGTVFTLNTDGNVFTNLYDFGLNPGWPFNTDGAYPLAEMILPGSTLYGTTAGGGHDGQGIVFAVNTDGSGFTNLHSLTGTTDGGIPNAGLVLSGNRFYGTAIQGGSFGVGTVFGLNTDGTGFQTLHNFNTSDGASPGATLISSGKTLCGTTGSGGISGAGTVFKINTDGSGFLTLHHFPATSGTGTNSDGEVPYSRLLLSDNTLYGTASAGGGSGNGTLFNIFILPELAITSAGNDVVLTWPTNYAGFTLQSATSLVAPVWTTNSPAPVVVSGQNKVTNPISGIQQFFRLSQ